MSTSVESFQRVRTNPVQDGVDRFLRARVLAGLAPLQGGQLHVHDAFGDLLIGKLAEPSAVAATIRIHDMGFYRQVALNGSVGAGEAYMDGLWSCDDLVALVRLLVRNRELLDGMETGLASLGMQAMRALHALRNNTRSGSRRNIAAHYDLGNEFFSLFLDSNLMYSSAIFANPEESLESASARKLDRICGRLELDAGDHLLEIGTGWGGMALHAATRTGCRVTTTTISREQHALASRRVHDAGLSDRVTVLLQDYRDLQGKYDKLVSIEMIEAIGHQYLDGYFARCSSLLEPGGLALIQAITIEDHRYQQALGSVDFIKRHVFPGSFIPCVSAIASSAASAGQLRLAGLEDIGPSYALTLQHWRRRFLARLDDVRAQGFDDCFLRMWEFYLCYCEGGFLEGAISDVQMLLAKPGQRSARSQPLA